MHSCPVCLKLFARKDSFNRHVKIHQTGRTARKWSCERCQRSKIKCSGDRPQCAACLRSSSACMYTRGSSPERGSRTGAGIAQLAPPLGSTLHLTSTTNQRDSAIADMTSNPTGFTPLSMNWASDTQNLITDQSFHQSEDPTGSLNPQPIFPTDLFSAGEECDLDWMFQISAADNEVNFSKSALSYETSNERLDDLLPPMRTPLNAQIPASTYQENDASKESWLLEETALTGRPLAIPKLGGDRLDRTSMGSHCQIERLTKPDSKRVQQFIKTTLDQPLWKMIIMDYFPSEKQIDYCIDLFFVNWRPAISFVHCPTFNPNDAVEILVLAIASIGARFTRVRGAALLANTIAEVVRRLLISAAERDPDSIRTAPYFTAQLLLGIYGYCSGDRTLFNYSESLRSSLVRHAKNIGLFAQARPVRPIEHDTKAQWAAWVQTERLKRLGWAIYEFDASVSFLHNRRPAISVGDILLDLPEDAARWDASTAHAWKALGPSQSSTDDSISFRVAVRSCFDNDLADPIDLRDPQHLHLIVITLARFLWSIKELQASPLMDVVPEKWPLVVHKASLLDKMDRYSASLSSLRAISDNKDLAQQAGRASIIHICHLYGASDLMDWLPALLRTSGLNKAARRRMKIWGEEDPLRLRRVAYHSAQIMAISRDFPFNAPYEPFHVFYAGAVLWCISSLLAEPGTHHAFDDNQQPIFLDRPVAAGTFDHLGMLKWIQEGGNGFVVGIYGVPVLGSPSSRLQVLEETKRILQNMRTWDLSTAFVNVLQQLFNAESANQ